jgi:hypothetical protein
MKRNKCAIHAIISRLTLIAWHENTDNRESKPNQSLTRLIPNPESWFPLLRFSYERTRTYKTLNPSIF